MKEKSVNVIAISWIYSLVMFCVSIGSLICQRRKYRELLVSLLLIESFLILFCLMLV